MSEDRAREGVEHLQAAAVEIIGALRAFLDVAEGVVRDPSAAAALAASLLEAARPAATPREGAPEPSERVTRMRVS